MNYPKIPNLTSLRQRKQGYDTRYTIDEQHPLYHDPLVDPRNPEYGFSDAQSYYSKPNKMTGEPLPGVPDAPLLRRDVVKRLMKANVYLERSPDVRRALGAGARLRIDDALRPYKVQKYAFEVAWPKIIKKMNPSLTDDEVAAQVPNYCAQPKDKLTPTPHLTGGAVDVSLINLRTGEPFARGHIGGGVNGTAYPDFYEGYQSVKGQSDIEGFPEQLSLGFQESEVLMSRRTLYFAMTQVAGMRCNPQEIWHYGIGDPLSEYVSGSNHPYYGIVDLPEPYSSEMAEQEPSV